MGVIFVSSNIRFRKDETVQPSPSKKKNIGDQLTRNVAIASLVLLSVVVLRQSGTQGQSFVQTLQNTIEHQWDQNVGKLTYVSNSLADSIQVFHRGSSSQNALICPVTAQVIQAWSADMPYLLYENAGNVFAAGTGEVTQIAHDDDDAYIVRIAHANDVNTLYYGLKTCFVAEGDPVKATRCWANRGPSSPLKRRKTGNPSTALICCLAGIKPDENLRGLRCHLPSASAFHHHNFDIHFSRPRHHDWREFACIAFA